MEKVQGVTNEINDTQLFSHRDDAFLGIPAIITHGNGLSLEMWSEIHTPAYIFGYMHFERQRRLKAERMKDATATEKPKAEPPKAEPKPTEGVQLSLF